MELPEQVSMQAELLGELALTVNGQPVLHESASTQQLTSTVTLPLQAGANALEVRLRSADDGAAHVRLFWTRPGLVAEALAPDLLWHDPLARPGLNDSLLIRSGRELLATRHCRRCHALPASLQESSGLPEMEMDTPNLADAGERFEASWLQQWITNPQALRNHVAMPRVSANCSPQEVADIAAYVVSLKSKSATAQATAARRPTRSLMRNLWKREWRLRRSGLHRLPSLRGARPSRPVRAHLAAIGAGQIPPGAMEGYLLAPHGDYAWRRMPDFQLTATEASGLAAYVRSRSQHAGHGK